MTLPASICVGAGLTTDGDGRLVVDACTNGGLCFDPVTECLEVCTQTLHHMTLTHSGNLTVPASTGATSSSFLTILYDIVVDSAGIVATLPNITITRTGRYYVAIGQRDSQTAGNDGATNLHTISAEVWVNGAQQIATRVPRLAMQTHVLHAAKIMALNAGDIVIGRYSIHSDTGVTAPLTLNPGATNFLQVQQIPDLAVIPA